jgi:hypothetical protein
LSTGESLQIGYRDGYTAQPITQNISSPSNVVLYTPAGQTDSYVIFQDEYYPEILSARWVADGNAVLLFVNNVDFESESMLLTRSGLILSQVSDSNFVAATVDGWLTNSFDTISYYQFDGERITLSYIEEPTGYVAIVATPALGSSLVDAPAFPEIEAP